VIGLIADIAHFQGEVSRNLPVHLEAPFLNGGCVHVGVETSRREGVAIRCYRRTATGLGRSSGDGNDRKQRRIFDRHTRGERRVGIQAVSEVVLKVVVNPKTGTHRPLPFAVRVPGDAHARLQERLGIVLPKGRSADVRVELNDAVRVKPVVGGVSVLLIPPSRHLIAQS